MQFCSRGAGCSCWLVLNQVSSSSWRKGIACGPRNRANCALSEVFCGRNIYPRICLPRRVQGVAPAQKFLGSFSDRSSSGSERQRRRERDGKPLGVKAPGWAEANFVPLPAVFVPPGAFGASLLHYSRGAGQGLAGGEPRQGSGAWRARFAYTEPVG